MKALFFLLSTVAVAWGMSAATAADEATAQKSASLFRKAFRRGICEEEQRRDLRTIARDYADTKWADDALWALSRLADRCGDRRSSLLMRRELLHRAAPPSLEPLTRKLGLYKDSLLPNVDFLLEYTGYRYEPEVGIAARFNALPMVLHTELAELYEQLGAPRMALEEYRKAETIAPPSGVLKRLYARRIQRLHKRCRPETSVAAQTEDRRARDGTVQPDSPDGESKEDSPRAQTEGEKREE